jgi:hypothetical protein
MRPIWMMGRIKALLGKPFDKMSNPRSKPAPFGDHDSQRIEKASIVPALAAWICSGHCLADHTGLSHLQKNDESGPTGLPRHDPDGLIDALTVEQGFLQHLLQAAI